MLRQYDCNACAKVGDGVLQHEAGDDLFGLPLGLHAMEYVRGGRRTFVFDWEYAGRTYIPHLDIVHHIVQSSMFAHRPSARELYDRLFRENSALMEQYFENPKIAVLCYLLDIFAKYAIRDASHETKDTEMLQKVRIELISLTLKIEINEI